MPQDSLQEAAGPMEPSQGAAMLRAKSAPLPPSHLSGLLSLRFLCVHTGVYVPYIQCGRERTTLPVTSLHRGGPGTRRVSRLSGTGLPAEHPAGLPLASQSYSSRWYFRQRSKFCE